MATPFRVDGRTALVTGGASGIGLGTTKVFVRNGVRVVIADARQNALDEVVAWRFLHKIRFPNRILLNFKN